MTESGPPEITLGSVVLDTDEPRRLAAFYGALLGWEVSYDSDDWVSLVGGGGRVLEFQLAINHVPPTWPGPEIPQQVHLDLETADLDRSCAYAESLGARRAGTVQRPGQTFAVLLDPSGHPFCLCLVPAPGTSLEQEPSTVSP